MNLVQSIREAAAGGRVPVIAEIKRRIPRLAADREPDRRDAAHLAACYRRGGAAGVSLVTEAAHFGGRPEEDIPAVLQSVELPLLIKDFILDRGRVDYYHRLASESGPGCPGRVALLLTAHLAGDNLSSLLEYVRERGMLALVETRGPEDLVFLSGLERPPALIGFNNKFIDDLEIGEDLVRLDARAVSRFRGALGDVVLVSESAHRCPADVRKSVAAGADAVLAGTAFMTSGDPAGTVARFAGAMEGGNGEDDDLRHQEPGRRGPAGGGGG